jgi:hypothetical protein
VIVESLPQVLGEGGGFVIGKVECHPVEMGMDALARNPQRRSTYTRVNEPAGRP